MLSVRSSIYEFTFRYYSQLQTYDFNSTLYDNVGLNDIQRASKAKPLSKVTTTSLYMNKENMNILLCLSAEYVR